MGFPLNIFFHKKKKKIMILTSQKQIAKSFIVKLARLAFPMKTSRFKFSTSNYPIKKKKEKKKKSFIPEFLCNNQSAISS